MPRKYARTTTRATSYSHEDLKTAIEKIKDKKLTYAAASREYGIPKSTLSDRALNKTGMKSNTLGRATAIPIEHENKLANCLRILEKWGWGLSREEVLDVTQEFIRKNELNTPFNNGRPGPDWFIAFSKRHNLSIKKPQTVEYLRKKMTDPFIIHDYFNLLERTLQELNLTDDPKKIWNLDETSLCLDPTRTKVVGAKGAACTRTTYGSAKENVTVLTTVNAAGAKLDPLIVYKGKYMYQQWILENTDYDFQLTYASSKRGWMESEIFYNYMLNVIIPNLGDERPVLLIYDGHISHVNDKVVALAVENNITILKLPPHTSHLLQPLDLAVFKSFKNTWDKNLVKWQRQNVGIKLRKHYFAKMFADAWQQIKPEVIKNGFKKGGICPFNASVIPKEKYDPNAYLRWQKHISQKDLTQPMALKQLCLNTLNKHTIDNDSPESSNKKQDYISFEEILLKQVTQQPQNTNNKIAIKLKRVAKGGEVVTKTFLDKQIEIEQNKEKDKEARKPTQRKKRKQGEDLEKPGVSGMQKERNLERTTSPVQMLTERDGDMVTETFLYKQIEKEQSKEKEAQKTTLRIKRKQTQCKKQVDDLATPGPSGLQKEICLEETTSPAKKSIYQTNSDQYTIAKGKGIGKKSRSNKSNVQKSIEKGTSTRKVKSIIFTQEMKKRANKRKRDSSDTTDESIQMSVHSDSDIHDTINDLELFDCDILNKVEPESEQIVKELQEIENNCDGAQNLHQLENLTKTPDNIVTILSSVKLTPQNQPFYQAHESLQLTPLQRDSDLFMHLPNKKLKKNEVPKTKSKDKKTKTDENLHEKEEYNTKINRYKIGDTVLVRYFKRVWRYYAGVIENIVAGVDDSNPTLYTISFYKSINKNTDVLFVIPKIKDHDCVPHINIVKEIRLLQIQENPEKYTIMDDDDAVYF